MTRYDNSNLTEQIISCAFEVHNILGTGFLEKVYENALLEELIVRGIKTEAQKPISVVYKGKVVGEYFADLVVEGSIIIELKALDKLTDIHEIQLKNYLKATNIKLGLLINFGKSVDVKRKYVRT
ncbi:MAG: GxxExxY protein [Desulfuromonadales bacterium]|nr:GxxExxY protein [Desulfuromonadales bacterium]